MRLLAAGTEVEAMGRARCDRALPIATLTACAARGGRGRWERRTGRRGRRACLTTSWTIGAEIGVESMS